jgi:hypothetical protein
LTCVFGADNIKWAAKGGPRDIQCTGYCKILEECCFLWFNSEISTEHNARIHTIAQRHGHHKTPIIPADYVPFRFYFHLVIHLFKGLHGEDWTQECTVYYTSTKCGPHFIIKHLIELLKRQIFYCHLGRYSGNSNQSPGYIVPGAGIFENRCE